MKRRELMIAEEVNTDGLQLADISVNEDYLKKWNVHIDGFKGGFKLLIFNGEPLRNTLYRVGGIGTSKIQGKDYFMLLKYIEEHYDDSITTDKKRKPHLAGHWCILDKHGNEKVVFDQFAHPYIVSDSVIYSVDRNYYNIETGELYCQASKSIDSGTYLFLHNAYDDDHSKRGVLKIHKKTGEFELIQ